MRIPCANTSENQQRIMTMPAPKADITITVKAGAKSVSIGGVRLLDGRLAIKRGRSWSKRRPTATLTEIFTEGRKWAARQME